jgi:hypothetical protein
VAFDGSLTVTSADKRCGGWIVRGLLGYSEQASFDSGWKQTNTGEENTNWYYAMYNFRYKISGRRSGDGSKAQCWVQVYKRYNRGTEVEGRSDLYYKKLGVTLVHVRQPDWAHLHTVGLVKDYDASGSASFSE